MSILQNIAGTCTMASRLANPKHNRLTPASIALLYAVLAELWIFASGYLLAFAVSDPLLLCRIELAKGLLFVAVTGTLLYLLLKEWCEHLYAGRSLRC